MNADGSILFLLENHFQFQRIPSAFILLLIWFDEDAGIKKKEGHLSSHLHFLLDSLIWLKTTLSSRFPFPPLILSAIIPFVAYNSIQRTSIQFSEWIEMKDSYFLEHPFLSQQLLFTVLLFTRFFSSFLFFIFLIEWGLFSVVLFAGYWK